MPWVSVQLCAHTGRCGFARSGTFLFSMAASLHTFSMAWMCTELLPQAAHTYISSLHLREHLFIHSCAHFDNQCRSFQHRGHIIDTRYLKYFCFLLHDSHGTWPVGFLEHLFNVKQFPWDFISPDKWQWINLLRKWRPIKLCDSFNVVQETDEFSGVGPDPSSFSLWRLYLTCLSSSLSSDNYILTSNISIY